MKLGLGLGVGVGGRGGAALNPAPTLVDWDVLGISTGADPDVFPTTNISASWLAGMRSHFVISMDTAATITSVLGSVDDTGALIDSNVGSGPDIYDYLMTVNGGAVDANWNVDLSATARAVLAALLFSGAVGVTAYGKANGTGGPYTAPAIVVPAGPRNVLAVQMISLQGSHVTNPATAPSGWSLLFSTAATTNNPTLDSRSTLAIATRTYNGVAGTIAATAWGGLADATLEPWRSMSFAVLS